MISGLSPWAAPTGADDGLPHEKWNASTSAAGSSGRGRIDVRSKSKCSPWNEKTSSVSAALTTWIDSAKTSLDWFMSKPSWRNSRRAAPRPKPMNGVRPRSAYCSSVMSSATRSGWCHGSTTTIVPMSMRVVAPAKNVSSCTGLGIIVYGLTWCSTVHSESKPRSSAIRAVSISPARRCRSSSGSRSGTSSPRSRAR